MRPGAREKKGKEKHRVFRLAISGAELMRNALLKKGREKGRKKGSRPASRPVDRILHSQEGKERRGISDPHSLLVRGRKEGVEDRGGMEVPPSLKFVARALTMPPLKGGKKKEGEEMGVVVRRLQLGLVLSEGGGEPLFKRRKKGHISLSPPPPSEKEKGKGSRAPSTPFAPLREKGGALEGQRPSDCEFREKKKGKKRETPLLLEEEGEEKKKKKGKERGRKKREIPDEEKERCRHACLRSGVFAHANSRQTAVASSEGEKRKKRWRRGGGGGREKGRPCSADILFEVAAGARVTCDGARGKKRKERKRGRRRPRPPPRRCRVWFSSFSAA